MIVDPDKVAAIIKEVAETEIAPRFGKLKAGEIDTKSGPNDFVTQADRAAEAALKRAFADIYPDVGFIGEEGAAADPSILDALHGDGAFWIVDPLDGTRNFVQQRDEFATIVALVVDGVTRAGWIYAIPDKTIAIASHGEGATWNGDALAPLRENTGVMSGYRAIGNLAEPWNTEMAPKLRAGLVTQSARCAAYAYIHLLTGKKDFALYSRCSPWDHAAGVLMLGEIGGRAAYLDENTPYRPVATQGRPLLVTGSEHGFTRVAGVLRS